MKNKIYGFIVSNNTGQQFSRWFNSPTSKVADNPRGELPFALKEMCIAQDVLSFEKAYDHSECTAKAKNLNFKSLYEKDFLIQSENPIKTLFKKLFKNGK